jgi:RimJ/RimL family protein N-acetyltransferase
VKIVLPAALLEGETALRPWRDTDLEQLVALCQDPEIGRWTRVPIPYTENDARLYLLHRYEQAHSGDRAPFAITTPDRETVLGSTSLMNLDWLNRNAEVGYWLGAAARGQGHATRAVTAICRWAFTELKLHRVGLLAATGNTASQHVAERAGFTREALLRSYARSRGNRDGRDDMVCYSLTAVDG